MTVLRDLPAVQVTRRGDDMIDQTRLDNAGFLAALHKLPPYDGITFRGLARSEPAPSMVAAAAGVMASSHSARVATENFTCSTVLAVLNRSGRDISSFSPHPDEQEVVLRPGSVWRPLTTLRLRDPDLEVRILEELDVTGVIHPPVAWGTTVEEVVRRVTRAIHNAGDDDPVPVRLVGKFAGPWVTSLPMPAQPEPRMRLHRLV
ncbi:hypothetical protein [Actinotalea sp. K2]|uniref:hypothetical protein n=1 Tax=Actinotalea sp. K2 TaxID=2939438 RepID=UPI00201811A3|nr:hypothetical protein [Actinotalea sp. K2]MCL3861664.1 hypothetical protein [Actinotalea sp. K2]